MKMFCMALVGLSLMVGAVHAAELTADAWTCKTPEGHDWLMQQSQQDRDSEDFRPLAKEQECRPAPAEPKQIEVLGEQAGLVHVKITYEKEQKQTMGATTMRQYTRTGWTSKNSLKNL